MDLSANNARVIITADFICDRTGGKTHFVGTSGGRLDKDIPISRVTIEGQHGEATALLRMLIAGCEALK